MPNTIQHKRSTTASAVPSGASLSAGEIAINTADGRLFIKKSDGTVVAIGRDASELNTGTVAAARLPAATGSTLGAIIVGTGLGVASGTVSVSYGSTSSSACVGNDARLSDTRTPTDGSVTTAKIADGAVTAAKIAASQALSVASVSATGNVSSNATVSGASLSASTGGLTVSAGAIVIETLGAVTTFRVSSGGFITSGTWQGATIAVANGGTGGTTAADARTNLGAAAASHTHGNITNAGAIGSTANLPIITTTSGVLTTGAFGTSAASFCEGNDSRLSDARTPLSHTHGNITNAGAIGSTANLPVITTTSGVLTTGTFGTAANSFCQGNDARLTKTIAFFTASDNQPPASSFAQFNTRNSIATLDFDAATAEYAIFLGVIPENASTASGLTVRLNWMATTATSGNVVWGVQLEKMTTDEDADSWDTATTATTATNATSGIPTISTISPTTIDSLAAGDFYRLRVYRDAAVAGDTMAGDAQLISVEVRVT